MRPVGPVQTSHWKPGSSPDKFGHTSPTQQKPKELVQIFYTWEIPSPSDLLAHWWFAHGLKGLLLFNVHLCTQKK